MSPDHKAKFFSYSLVVSYQWMDWFLTQEAIRNGKASEVSPIAQSVINLNERDAFNAFKLVLAPALVLLIGQIIGKYVGKKFDIPEAKFELLYHRLINAIFLVVLLNNVYYTYIRN